MSEKSNIKHLLNTRSTSRAFIIGNGPSRLDIPLEKLRPYGKIYGCNALYRDFTPDYLIVADKEMQTEVEQSNYSGRRIYKSSLPSHKNQADASYYKLKKGIHNNSGLMAIYFALKHGHTDIWLIGFDFALKGTTHNIYEGTRNYKSPSGRRDRSKPVVKLLREWIDLNKEHVRFVRVVNEQSADVNLNCQIALTSSLREQIK